MPVSQRESDDFDMAKLQKSLKKEQQRSNRMRHIVTKLSPAEIRSLNNNAIKVNKSATSAHVQPHRANSGTPPLTPENLKPRQHSASGQSGVNLPTPPGSPEDSSVQRKNSNPTNVMHIHSPVPLSHHKAGFVNNNNNGSRSPSVSSHRSMPTYRGNEVTRNRSLSMLRPTELTHQIVDNPLSQFSRPRQSLSNGSVSPSRQEPGHHTSTEYHPRHRHSVPVMNGSITPPQSVKSSVSALDDEGIVVSTSSPLRPAISRAQTVSVDEPLTTKPSSRFSWSWRRSLLPQHSEEKNTAEAKKSRRKSWSRSSYQDLKSIAYEDTKSGNAPEVKRSLKGDLPSDMKTTTTKNQDAPLPVSKTFSAHPGVRPLNSQDAADSQTTTTTAITSDKGKQREEVTPEFHDVFNDDSVPMYSRCSCCGKFKKQPGSRALSPVFENENLRTNLSFEIEKTDDLQMKHRRSSSSIRQKYTPIIPMVMAEGNTVQAKVAPKLLDTIQQQPQQQPPVSNLNHDISAQKTEQTATVPKKVEEKERKIVRFSSLNLKKDTEKRKSIESGSNKPTLGTAPSPHDERQIEDRDDRLQVQPLQEVPDLSPGDKDSKHLSERVAGNLSSKSISEELDGALMAAMSGIDLSFDVTLPQIQQSGNTSILIPVTGVNTASSSHNAKPFPVDPVKAPTTYEQVTTDQLETKPDVTERQVEQAPSDSPLSTLPPPTVTSRPKSILKQTPRSSYNNSPRTSVDYSYSPPTTYMPPELGGSARGAYVTRPKATARYMHVAPLEVRTGPTIRTTTTTTTSIVATTTGPSIAKSRPNSQAVVMDDAASSNGSVSRRTNSSDELSARRLSSQSSRSYTSFRSKKWLQPRKQSNLADSVLSATKTDKMSKFERAVSRV